MGQRAGILLKRNFADGTSRVDLLHHQWAFGKILPAYFMQEVLKIDYDMNKGNKNYFGKSMQESGYMAFALLFGDFPEDYHYIINGKACLSYGECDRDFNNIDVWDIDTIMELYGNTDNNNGGMIVEVTEKKEKVKWTNEHIEIKEIKIGFLLGEEECRKITKECGQQENPFERIVSAREYMERTGGKECCPKCSVVMFEKFLKIFNVVAVEKTRVKEEYTEIKEGENV